MRNEKRVSSQFHSLPSKMEVPFQILSLPWLQNLLKALGSCSVLYRCYYLFAQKYQSKPSILEAHSYPSTWLLWIWNPPRIWSWDSGEIISHKVAIICQSKCADTEDYLRVRRSSSKWGSSASWCLPMRLSQCLKGLYDTASGFPQSREMRMMLQYLSVTKVTYQEQARRLAS